ncbi:MAG: DUF6787 family protein [Maribacter sp.]
MQKFKENWQIQQNWQLLFPLLGLIGIVYSAYKLAKTLTKDVNFFLNVSVTLVLSFLIVKLCLFFFRKLESKWIVKYRWEMIRIFMVFAITGSSSLLVSRPIIKLMGITKENLNVFIYWILFVLISLIFYQILLVLFGWLLGQFQFFWNFEQKMLSRFGLGFLFEKKS